MKEITTSEMEVLLTLVKSPEIDYNANNLSKIVHLTPMGTLKILKRLEQESILKSKKIGQARIYSIDRKNNYGIKLISLILIREAQHSSPRIKRWVEDLKRVQNSRLIILFGSVLEKDNPNDIDVLFVTNKKSFQKLQKEIEDLNQLSNKKIHPLYQTYDDLIKNIKERHLPLLNAIKGIIIRGEELFLEVYHESR